MATAMAQLSRALSRCSIAGGPRTTCGAAPTASATPLASSLRRNRPQALRSSHGKALASPRRRKTTTGVIRAAASALQDDEYEETEEEIEAAYEALYGKPFGQGKGRQWDGVEDKDAEAEDGGGRGQRRSGERAGGGKRDDRGGGGARGAKGDLEERVVQIRRVTKVVKGGKQLSFRAVVVVGDKKGKVGVGVNKAKEVITAVQKAAINAKKNFITVPMTKYKTFPHRADGHFGAAHVMLRPASVGTGVIAGGAVRVMLELAGVENALGKQIRSENPLNNARAVVHAISTMKTFRQVSIDRGIPMEELWK